MIRRLLRIHSPSAHAAYLDCPACSKRQNLKRRLRYEGLWEQ